MTLWHMYNMKNDANEEALQQLRTAPTELQAERIAHQEEIGRVRAECEAKLAAQRQEIEEQEQSADIERRKLAKALGVADRHIHRSRIALARPLHQKRGRSESNRLDEDVNPTPPKQQQKKT